MKIYNEDCLEVLDRIEKVQLILTSPPYFNAKEYSQWEKYEDYLLFIDEVFTKAYDVLEEGRMCIINVSPVIVPRESRNTESKRMPIPYHIVNIMEKIGYKFLEDIIWEKPEGSVANRNGNFFRTRKPVMYKPNLVHEYILVFQKPSNFLIDKILKNNKDKVEESLVEDGYERSSIWKINPVKNKKHPAVFPQELSDKLIEYYSFKGDTVLDMFMGIGTTGKSCIKYNRDFIGIEKEDKYYEESKRSLIQ